MDFLPRDDLKKSIMMETIVLPNKLCVLFVPEETLRKGLVHDVRRIFFNKTLQAKCASHHGEKNITGRNIASDTPVCTLFSTNGMKLDICSPLCGKVIEINYRLEDLPNLLYCGYDGYIAVVRPDNLFLE